MSILMNLKNSYDSEDILVVLHVLEYEKLFLKVSFVCISAVKTSVPRDTPEIEKWTLELLYFEVLHFHIDNNNISKATICLAYIITILLLSFW